MSKIIQGKFPIIDNKKYGPDYFNMEISAPEIVQQAHPGQFVHLRCDDGIEPLLRRPFSFHRLNHTSFEIFYKIVGKGTNLLAKKQKDDTIDVLGPLGNGFAMEKVTSDTEHITMLVAGGMGVAPLLAWADDLVKRGVKADSIVVLLGARNKKHIFCVDDFKELGVKLYVTTDDGTRGYSGLVTEIFEKVLSTTPTRYQLGLGAYDIEGSSIYACGPRRMLQEVARICVRFNVSAYASLEENMACGLGACLGCAVKTHTGYQRVCKEGPVFNLKDVIW